MRVFTLPLLALALSACASSGTGQPATRERTQFRSDVLTAAEIENSGRTNLLDAIQMLRPRYLTTRRAHDGRAPVVYINNLRLGGPDQLATMTAQSVAEVRWLSAIEATTRYGTGHTGGAIVVFTVGSHAARTW
jgi:hypothetical protein